MIRQPRTMTYHDLSKAEYLQRAGWSNKGITQHFNGHYSQLEVATALRDTDALTDIRAQQRQQNRATRHPCIDCGTPVARRASRCRDCWAKHMATTVRDDELLCVSCRQWKPDNEFTARGAARTRRYHDYYCTDCRRRKAEAA